LSLTEIAELLSLVSADFDDFDRLLGLMSLLLKFFFDRLQEKSSDSDSESITQTSSPPVEATLGGFTGTVLHTVLVFGWVLFVSATLAAVLVEQSTVSDFEDVSFDLF